MTKRTRIGFEIPETGSKRPTGAPSDDGAGWGTHETFIRPSDLTVQNSTVTDERTSYLFEKMDKDITVDATEETSMS